MPKRSNEFQELVDIIHRLFAPQNAKVTTSAMIAPAPGMPPREVDVLVEYDTDLYPVRIAVEASHRSRAIGLKTIDEYAGKYNTSGGICVDKVIIVGRAFTTTASQRARDLGFELHTLNTLADSKVGMFSQSQQENGAWWIGKDRGFYVRVILIGEHEKRLADPYLYGKLVSRQSESPIGSPFAFAFNILDTFLGEQVTKTYSEHAGEVLDVYAEVECADHKIEMTSYPTERLQKIILYFGERARIPDMQAELVELRTGPNKAKTIVHEKGKGAAAKVRIVYEDADKPTKLHLQGIPAKVTRVATKLLVTDCKESTLCGKSLGDKKGECAGGGVLCPGQNVFWIPHIAEVVVKQGFEPIVVRRHPSTPEGCEAVASKISEVFQDMKFTLHKCLTIYNVFSGVQEEFPLVLDLTIAGVNHCRIGLVFNTGKEAASEVWIHELASMREGCELDRIVAVSRGGVDASVASLAANCGIAAVGIRGLPPTAWISTMVPDVLVCFTSIRTFQCILGYEGSASQVKITDDTAMCFPNGQRFSALHIGHIVGNGLREALISSLARRAFVNPFWIDLSSEFLVAVPQGVYLEVPGCDRVEVESIFGSAVVRILCGVLSQKRVIRAAANSSVEYAAPLNAGNIVLAFSAEGAPIFRELDIAALGEPLEEKRPEPLLLTLNYGSQRERVSPEPLKIIPKTANAMMPAKLSEELKRWRLKIVYPRNFYQIRAWP